MSRVTQEQLPSVARDLLARVANRGDRTGAAVVALSGELGAGKTSLVKTLARELGLQDEVRSPTFVIEQVYTLPKEALFDQLIHIDAYRLERGEELSKLGWGEIVADNGNLIVVEWAENVEDILPDGTVWVTMEVSGEEERDITITNA